MAKSSTRRVNIYINGKEVEASVKQIRAEMNRIVAQTCVRDCSTFTSRRRICVRAAKLVRKARPGAAAEGHAQRKNQISSYILFIKISLFKIIGEKSD